MDKVKKILSMFLAFVLTFAVVMPGVVKADSHKTNLHITKLKADSFPNGAIDHTGEKKELDDLKTPLGTTVEGLKGVQFTYWKVDDQKFEQLKAAPQNYDTVDKVKVFLANNDEGKTTGETNANGVVDVELENGNYWFVESKRPDNVSSSVAVPFGISLPLTNPENVGANGEKAQGTKAGTVLMTDVYVYPKNVVGEEPNVDKTVGDVNKKTLTEDIGKELTWYIQGSVPSPNIKDYVTFELSDKLDNALTFTQNSVKVYYAKPDGNANKVELTENTHYTLTKPNAGVKGGDIEVKLNAAGIKLLGDNFATVGKTGKVFVEFKAKINEDAVMGKEIANNAKIKFKNSPNTSGNPKEKEIPEQQRPKVVTGGKKFIKVKKAEEGTKLADAVFQLKNKNQEIKWTEDLIKANMVAIKAKKFAVDEKGKDVEATEDQAIITELKGKSVYLKSVASGEFEIKGLQYSEFQPQKWDANQGKLVDDGAKITNKYVLSETKAPSGYAKIEQEIEFTIDKDSYTADAQKIENKKLTIPQTGGMGTLIFTVVGLSIMVVAVVAMKKRKEQN